MIRRRIAQLTVPALLLGSPLVIPLTIVPAVAATSAPAPAQLLPQGTQTDTSYANSFAAAHATNVDATSGQVSCYRPEVPYFTNNGPNDGYTGMSACPGATTGEDTGAAGPYATQIGSNPGYPAANPMLVKDHSESDIRVDPTNSMHLIGSVKWIVSAEGYNHLLGFYESFDGGQTWTHAGHIPGYEGWTDNTDPVGAFDGFGNYYEFILPYQFYYNADGTHDYKIGTPLEPNPAQPAEAVAMAVRPRGAASATDWITTHAGHPDFVATYDSVGNEPDKQWMTIDANPNSPHYNRIYAMWVDFHTLTPVPFVSYADARPNGTHTDWSTPQKLPLTPHNPQGVTYLLPHVDPNGTIYTTLTNFNPKKGYCCASVFVDKSTDGGKTWSVAGTAVPSVTPPPLIYPNTTFRDGIENTFAVGNQLDSQGQYPPGQRQREPCRRVPAQPHGGGRWHGQRELLRPAAGLPRRRIRRGPRSWAGAGPGQPQLHGQPAALRRGQLLREREHPVLRPESETARAQHPADGAYVGSAAQLPAPRERER